MQANYLNDKITADVTVACFQTDIRYLLRPAAFLDLAQESAIIGAETLNFGDTQLRPYDCAWVLARQTVRFERPVRHGDRIKMVTWHKGLDGPYFRRDYQLLDAEGRPAVNSTSSWVIMNMAERRIARAEFISEIVPDGPQSPDHAIGERAGKVVIPRGAALERIGTHCVRYSDVDHNRHANNVKYTAWAMDALPQDLVCNKSVRELTVNFNREARPGETVELLHALAPDGAHIVEGRAGDRQVFIERLLFEE